MDTGQAPDGHVLVADMMRDDGTAETLLLIKPWSFNPALSGIAVAGLLQDGSIDGQTWHSVQVPGE